MSKGHSKYDLKDAAELPPHDPKEGFDATEPHARQITLFVILSVITLAVTIAALQYYFDKVWNQMVYENVLAVPGGELADQRSLEDWRLTHYEYTDKSKTTVRIPFERAKALFLEEAKQGKTFYPAKPTEPKPETPAAPEGAAPAQGKAAEEKK